MLATTERLFSAAASAAVAVLMLVVVADVVVRYLYRSIPGVIEGAQALMVAVVFLGLAYAQSTRGHLGVDVVVERLSPRARRWLDVVVLSLSMLIVGLLSWQGGRQAYIAWLVNDTTGGLVAYPLWPSKLMVAVGSTLLFLRLGVQLTRAIRGMDDPGTSALPKVTAASDSPDAADCSLMAIDNTLIGVIGMAGFLVLLASGMRIGFAAALIGFLGIWAIRGMEPALVSLGTAPYSLVSKYVFIVIPLFIFMGHLAVSARLAEDVFWAGRQWLGRFPGGLASATVVGGAGFAAVSGSSVAATAVLAKAALPEMERYGYSDRLSAGTIASVGTFAAMIPPSALLVVYGIMTEQSVGRLLVAGFLPGLLTAALYIAMITIRVARSPTLGPPALGATWRSRFASLKGVWGIGLLLLLVMGGIYAGFFTPTESGAIGAMGALLLGVARRRLTRAELWEAMVEAGKTTCVVFLTLMGVIILTTFLSLSQIPTDLARFIAELDVSPMLILLGFGLLYLVLGMFLDSLGMLVLTLPVVYPVTRALGLDPIWVGILIVKMCEIGLVTPPVGLNLFVVKGVAPRLRMQDIYMGVLPFVAMDAVAIILLALFPAIVLILPASMGF